MRICINCRWHEDGCRADPPMRCGHPNVVYLSRVDGGVIHPPCHEERAHGTNCGPQALLYEEPAVYEPMTLGQKWALAALVAILLTMLVAAVLIS